MPKHHRDFKGVWIPKEIWLASDLSLKEKVLFVEIQSLDNERGCWASNRHFSEFLEVGERQVRNLLQSLQLKGYIAITLKDKFDRTIRCAGKFARSSDLKLKQYKELTTMRRKLASKVSTARL